MADDLSESLREQARAEIATHLAAISRDLFRPEMRMTFVARHPDPGRPDCWMMVTDDDDLAAVAAVLTRPGG